MTRSASRAGATLRLWTGRNLSASFGRRGRAQVNPRRGLKPPKQPDPLPTRGMRQPAPCASSRWCAVSGRRPVGQAVRRGRPGTADGLVVAGGGVAARCAAVRTTGGPRPKTRRPGAGTDRRTGKGTRTGRRRHAREGRLPRNDEPRDPQSNERNHRHDAARDPVRPRTGPARPRLARGRCGPVAAISRQFVEQRQGSIAVDSTLGQGSCFQFSLPFEVAGMPPPVVAPRDDPGGGSVLDAGMSDDVTQPVDEQVLVGVLRRSLDG